MQLTEEQAMERLRAAIAAVGNQRQFALKYGLSTTYVSDVLHGKRDLTGRILEALHLEKIVMYRDTHPDNLPIPNSSAF